MLKEINNVTLKTKKRQKFQGAWVNTEKSPNNFVENLCVSENGAKLVDIIQGLSRDGRYCGQNSTQKLGKALKVANEKNWRKAGVFTERKRRQPTQRDSFYRMRRRWQPGQPDQSNGSKTRPLRNKFSEWWREPKNDPKEVSLDEMSKRSTSTSIHAVRKPPQHATVRSIVQPPAPPPPQWRPQSPRGPQPP